MPAELTRTSTLPKVSRHSVHDASGCAGLDQVDHHLVHPGAALLDQLTGLAPVVEHRGDEHVGPGGGQRDAERLPQSGVAAGHHGGSARQREAGQREGLQVRFQVHWPRSLAVTDDA